MVTALGLQNYFEFSCFASVSGFYRGEELDADLIEWLAGIGFTNIYLGTDGACDAVLTQNGKGCRVSQAILLNHALLLAGIMSQHNMIWTTPDMTRDEMMENALLYHFLPFRFNPLQNTFIIPSLGTPFTNQWVAEDCGYWDCGLLDWLSRD